jgi:threonine/homoserine/homoserine lactone efflux protein
MDFLFLLKGLVIGFSIAAPVGPIGMLCLRRTLAEGRLVGFVSGLGAATADGMYGAIAAFGLTAVSGFLVGEQVWFRLVGGIFLLYLGAKTFFDRPSNKHSASNTGSLLKAYASTLVLTISNPVTILAFAAVFAGLGVTAGGGNHTSAALLVAGVFLGSAVWWLMLSMGVGISRSRFNETGLRWVNRIAGAVIFGFGLAALSLLR